VPVAETGSVRLAWSESGSGSPPIVVVPQWFLSSATVGVSPLVGALSSRHRVVCYDRRGTGASDKPGAPYTTASDAKDLVALVDAIPLEPAVLLGLGVRGSQVALAAAAQAPDHVHAIICIGGTPKWAASAEWPYGIAAGTFHKAFTAPGAGMPPLEAGDEATAAAMRRDWETTGAEAAMDILNRTLDEDLRPILGRVTTPALVIHLRDDPLVRFEAARWLAESLRNGHLEVFDAGRDVPMSAPIELAEHIDEFLSMTRA
jgi:pimeloyl-ACP methyl ester carboxylesterase